LLETAEAPENISQEIRERREKLEQDARDLRPAAEPPFDYVRFARS